MKKYRKKPVIIEAIELRPDNIKEVEEFKEGCKIEHKTDIAINKFEDYADNVIKNGMKINTLEGVMTAQIGDYVIKGINGEFYPCKPDIFHKTYDEVL